MTERPKPPQPPPREAKLAEALRANLRRRKAAPRPDRDTTKGDDESS